MPDPVLPARLYAADVSVLEDDRLYAAAYCAVSDERQKKADRFRFRKDRNLCLGAGVLLRFALREAGVLEENPTYRTGENGKPYLFSYPNIFFNLSHSGSFVLCALSGVDVGCDIEKMEDAELALAKRFFTPGEYAAIASRPSEAERADRFYRIWTLKESFLKATGLGLRLPLNGFEILSDGEAVSIRQDVDPRSFRFQTYDNLSGYQCALCEAAEAGETELEVLSLRELLFPSFVGNVVPGVPQSSGDPCGQ